MWVVRIEPDKPGHRKRTFECETCGREEILVTKYR
jgi:hypothetical protein